ncbi:diacylglycerol kinase (ATP) [Synchytrium microbalum]|uniref:Diacylglycerol kinase n=1 Tax=Synchytrium microbalum TaxID=1806994 RepID=A0A507C644_9FUNG|nr:diacylglycerol kinase (ATP) [Synchytrium microbalum]TPX34818.1 diacylglycerol kinase (ATP) [Synchytrium microbalum]
MIRSSDFYLYKYQDSLRSIFGVYGTLFVVSCISVAITYQIFRFLYPRTLTYLGVQTSTSSSKTPPSFSHIWTTGGSDDRGVPKFCNACGTAIVLHGIRCLICGRCAHKNHHHLVNNQPCKKHYIPASTPTPSASSEAITSLPHQWVEGNLHLIPDARCAVCHVTVGIEPGLHSEYRCSWCSIIVHHHCLPDLPPQPCSLGPIPSIVVPPWCVSPNTTPAPPPSSSSPSAKRQTSPSKQLQPRLRVDLSQTADVRPLLCIVNPKSGAQDAPILLRSLYQILNPIQIVDTSRQSPEDVLMIFSSCLSKCRVLVCGGDGTIGWVLNVLDKLCLNPDERPPVGTLPMGTGNDLARSLGWGGGWAGEELLPIIAAINLAQVIELDRWSITIASAPKPSSNPSSSPAILNTSISASTSLVSRTMAFAQRPAFATKTLVCTNYFSAGADARIVLDFHRARESQPQLFRNRLINKAWYAVLGGRQVVLNILHLMGMSSQPSEPASSPTVMSPQHTKLVGSTLQLGSSPPITLDHLGGAIILNISSYGGGCQIYKPLEAFGAPSQLSDDGQFEALGVGGPFHMGASIAGLSSPEMLGQASVARLYFPMTAEMAMQLDGEPFLQKSPCTVDIAFHSRVKMLKRRGIVVDVGVRDESEGEEDATASSSPKSVNEGSWTDGTLTDADGDGLVGSSLAAASRVKARRAWSFFW